MTDYNIHSKPGTLQSFAGFGKRSNIQRHAGLDVVAFISRIETKLRIAHNFQKDVDAPVGGLRRLYTLKAEDNDGAPIAPWSASTETKLNIFVPELSSPDRASSHLDDIISDIFSDVPETVHADDFVWRTASAFNGATQNESLIWTKAPNPLWNDFMERQLTAHGENTTWSYQVKISLHKLFCILYGIEDIRLAEAPRSMTLSTISYTFGLSLPHVDFNEAGSDALVASQLRSADISVNHPFGRCERLSLVRDDANFGVSCAITLSRISEQQRPYTIDEGRQDVAKIIAAMSERLVLEHSLIKVSQPVINLTSTVDLSKELILMLAGGNGVLAITLKRFVDREIVCKRLRGLETNEDFWTSYEHELYDKETRTKRYEFYGVYRPKIAYPFNRTYLEPPESAEWNTYFDSSRALGEQLRGILTPFEYPIDRFLSHLDTLLHTNVHIHPKFGKKMQAGMLRLMPNDSFTGIHVDRPPDADLGQFRNILSTNFYTAPSSAEKGGELLIWDAPSIQFGTDLSRIRTDFVSVHLSPEEGDAIMICPELPHAIARVTEGKRLSLNVFLGLAADGERLSVWN